MAIEQRLSRLEGAANMRGVCPHRVKSVVWRAGQPETMPPAQACAECGLELEQIIVRVRREPRTGTTEGARYDC